MARHISARKLGDSIPLAGSFNEELIRTRTGFIVNATSPEELAKRYPAAVNGYKAGMRSMLTVPLISQGEVIGILVFRSKAPNVYTERDLSLAQRIGDQIAGAIANAQIYATLKRADEEMAVIAQIGRIIGSSLDIDEVYERFTLEVKKLIGFDMAFRGVDQPKGGFGANRPRHPRRIFSFGGGRGMSFHYRAHSQEKVMQTRKGLRAQF